MSPARQNLRLTKSWDGTYCSAQHRLPVLYTEGNSLVPKSAHLAERIRWLDDMIAISGSPLVQHCKGKYHSKTEMECRCICLGSCEWLQSRFSFFLHIVTDTEQVDSFLRCALIIEPPVDHVTLIVTVAMRRMCLCQTGIHLAPLSIVKEYSRG